MILPLSHPSSPVFIQNVPATLISIKHFSTNLLLFECEVGLAYFNDSEGDARVWATFDKIR